MIYRSKATGLLIHIWSTYHYRYATLLLYLSKAFIGKSQEEAAYYPHLIIHDFAVQYLTLYEFEICGASEQGRLVERVFKVEIV